METTFATELGVRVVWDDKKVQSGIARTEGDIRGFVSNVKSSLAQGMGQALGQFGLQTVAQGVKTVAMQMLNANAEFEDFNTQFEVLLGSASKAKSFYKELNQFALKTPFEIGDLANVSQVMLSFGIDAKKIMPYMRQLGDVSLGNKQKFQSLGLAFSQVMATGRLMGQDLLQMINQGFNPLTIISEKTGLSMAELKKKMEAGAISSEMVAEAFKVATSEGGRFYGGMEKGSQTFKGLKSTALDAINAIVREIGEPFFAQAKKGLVKFIEYVGSDEGKSAIKNMVSIAAKAAVIGASFAGLLKGASLLKGLAPVFSTISSALIGMAGQTGALIGMSKGATMAAGAMGYLKAAFAALTGPVGIAIAIITALVAAYTTNFAGFRDFVNGIAAEIGAFFQGMAIEFGDFLNENEWLVEGIKKWWDDMKRWWVTLFRVLMDVVAGAWGIIKNVIRLGFDYITGLVKFFKQVFNGDWAGAWETAKETLQKVWGSFVAIVWNAILAILKIIDSFADFFAASFGMDFTLLDGAIETAKGIIAEYEVAVKKSNKEIRSEIKKTADEQKKANKDSFNAAMMDSLNKDDKKKGKGKAEKSKSEVTKDLLMELASGIRTPAGKASCAYFASEMLKQTGVSIKGTGGAKALIDQVKAAGGYSVNAGQAKAGDLVYYRGPGYGAQKYNEGGQRVGYHVGIYRGDGYVVDSSDGKKRMARELGSDAKFVRPKRTGKYANVEETSVKQIEDYNNALKAQEDLVLRHRQAMTDLWREQLKINGAKQSAIFQWEYERGMYPEMTKAQYEQRLGAMKYNEQLTDRIRIKDELKNAYRQSQASIAEYLSSAQKELSFSVAKTEVDKLGVMLKEKQLKASSAMQAMALAAAAAALDANREKIKGEEAYSKALEEVNGELIKVTRSTKEAALASLMAEGMSRDQAESIWGKREELAGLQSYKEHLKEITLQMLELSLGTEEATIQQLMLNESMTREQAEDIVSQRKRLDGLKAYKDMLKELNLQVLELTLSSREWQIQELMATQNMTRAQAEEIVKRKEAIEKLKDYKKLMEEIAGTAADATADAIMNMQKGWSNFFSGVINSFRQFLQDLIRAYLRSQFYKIIINLMNPKKKGDNESADGGNTSSTSSSFGDVFSLVSGISNIFSSFGGFKASGGFINSGASYVAGENGPELISPTSHSMVYNSNQTAKLLNNKGGGGSTIINLGGITINGVKDAESFKRNEGQIQAALFGMLKRAEARG